MFAEAFVDEGLSVWWDASLHSGETFDEVIEQKLRDAGAVVVLWSPRSVASRWVRAEATQADRRNKLVPAIIEPCDRPIIFELTHAADLCEWTGDITDIHWRTFVDDLRHLIAARSEREATPAPPPAHKPEAHGAAPPVSRQPLRPGSDQVIVPHHAVPERSARPHVHPEKDVQTTPDVDASADVHCLEVEELHLGEDLFVIDSAEMKIGRTPPADIVLSHRSVSREHCMIGSASDELLVTDLNSTNGTYVDDVRISRATILPVGSVLRVGQVSLRHAIRNRAEIEQRAGLGGGSDSGRWQAGRVAASS